MSQNGVIADCWSHPIDCITTVLIPGDGGDTVAEAQVRAYGVDPATGGLVNPNFAKPAGYDPANGLAFVKRVEAEQQAFYDRLYQQNLSSNTLLPPAVSDFFGDGNGGISLTKLLLLFVLFIVAIIVIAKVV